MKFHIPLGYLPVKIIAHHAIKLITPAAMPKTARTIE
jgi:hypothetical protein